MLPSRSVKRCSASTAESRLAPYNNLRNGDERSNAARSSNSPTKTMKSQWPPPVRLSICLSVGQSALSVIFRARTRGTRVINQLRQLRPLPAGHAACTDCVYSAVIRIRQNTDTRRSGVVQQLPWRGSDALLLCLRTLGGGIKQWWCLTFDVCLSRIHRK